MLSRRGLAAGIALLALGCRDRVAPPAPVPANVEIVADLPADGPAGGVAGPFVVRVTDAGQRPLSGVLVSFALSLGGGQVSPASDTTTADGTVSVTLTLSTVPGANQVAVAVPGLAQVYSAVVTGAAGPARAVFLNQRIARIAATQDSLVVSATVRDEFGNVIQGDLSWTSRHPALLRVTGSQNVATLHALTRPGQTYVVAALGSVSDSVLIAVHDANSSPCDYLASPVTLSVGGSVSFEGDGLACVHHADSAEYAVVGHYNTALASAALNVSITARGIIAPASSFPAAALLQEMPGSDAAISFETGLRARERAGVGPRLDGARAWYDARSRFPMASLATVSREGDLTEVNVNAFDFCTQPLTRSARVTAITGGTLLLEDTSNPAGGFTPEEYRALAQIMDTLVMPVDTAAFGAPTDIDGNGRIAILFTRAVNELTPRGSGGGIVLGFFYARDLLPRESGLGFCPGSNVGEMFYVLVPDPTGTVSDPRSKAFVQGVVISTIAHELQHLINASRRMYVTRAPETNEETWLNEGLSHIAEELVFYRASSLGPRQNIGATDLAPGSVTRQMHDLYMRGNFGRLTQYLRATDVSSPFAANDLLATRGAAWAFLRYVADRAGATDGDLWRRLVDSRMTGVVNLDAQLASAGLTSLGALRDWSIAAVVDDNVAGAVPAFYQPSWNFVSALPGVGFAYGPVVPVMTDGIGSVMQLRAGGSRYVRFGVAPDRKALLQITSGGGVAQPGVRLTVVRIE